MQSSGSQEKLRSLNCVISSPVPDSYQCGMPAHNAERRTPSDSSFEGRVPSVNERWPQNERPQKGALMLTKWKLLVAVSSLAFFICPALYGQANGSFSGTVSDKAGAVVSGATVKA